MQKEYKYKAFISYSHQNEKFGKWLHKSLEKYKIPKELRKEYADLPDKLYPIFRDREELPTSSDLSRNITEALKNSKYLIVICSVASAKSFWVNQEIIDFKSMHSDGEDRILAIILDGEPHAKDSDRFDDALECFPEALKYRVVDRKLSDQPTEPIAGDVREGKDGKEFGKLKLIAGLLGVGFEEIYRREEKRAKQRRAFLVGALGGVSALAGVSVWKWREASEKSIALEKQKIVLQDEVERAKHNVGLALLEKAKLALKDDDRVRANLYAYGALENISQKYDTSNVEVNTLSILINNPYIKTINLFDNCSKVTSMAISNDENIIISALDNGKINIFNMNNLKKNKTLEGHKNQVSCVVFSKDEKAIISSSWDKTIKIWDFDTGKEIRTLQGHQNIITKVAISPNGKRIISNSDGGAIKIWDFNTGKEIQSYKGYVKSLLKSDISSNGKIIAIGSLFGSVNVYNIENKDLTSRNLVNQQGSITSLTFFKDAKRIISNSNNNTIIIWNIYTGKVLQQFKGHTDSITSVVISSDEKKIISASSDNTIKIWNIEDSSELYTLKIKGNNYGERNVIISMKNKTIISSAKSEIKVWDFTSIQKLRTLKGHKRDINSIVISNNKKIIFSASWDGTIKIWDSLSGKKLKTIQGHIYPINCISISSDETKIISASNDKTIKVWDISSGKKLKIFKGHKSFINCVVISPDNKKIISASNDATIKIWDFNNNKELKTLTTGNTNFILSLAISSDGRKIISGSTDTTIRIWDINTGKILKILKGHTQPITSLIVSTNGQKIISGSWDTTIRIWDINTGKELKKLIGHKNSINKIIISTNNQKIISCDGELFSQKIGVIKIWDINTGKEIKTLIGKRNFPKSISISHDEEIIVSGLENGMIEIWDKPLKKADSKLKDLEQQLQAKLDGIKLIPTKIPYTKPIWSKYHPNHWLEDAENGDARAMYELGLIYDRDNENQTALKWYKKSDKAGYKEAKERVEFLEKWMNENV